MKNLNANWLTEGWIDYEYKQYLLLDYLQKADSHFSRKSLYPVLSDLVFHYNNLVSLKENQNLIAEQIPRRLDKIDLADLKMVYKQIDLNDKLMQELDRIIDFAIPKFQEHIQHGKELYDWVEHNMEMDSVGLRPIYDKEGYLFIGAENDPTIKIYRYQMSQIKNKDDFFFALQTNLVKEETVDLANHYNNVKLHLLKEHKDLPNPATFVVLSKTKLPYKSTLLPVAERLLMRTLNNAA